VCYGNLHGIVSSIDRCALKKYGQLCIGHSTQKWSSSAEFPRRQMTNDISPFTYLGDVLDFIVGGVVAHI